MKPRIRRIALALASVWLIYVAVANGLLATPWGRRLVNSAPQRFTANWESCWTAWPGMFHLRGAQCSGTSRRVTWTATADRAFVRVAVVPLVWRTIRLPAVHARGATFVMDRPPEDVAAGLPPPKEGRGRTIRFDDVRCDDLRQFRWRGLSLSGTASARLAMSMQTRGGPTQLSRLRFDMSSGTLDVAERTVARDLHAMAELSSEPFVAREHPGASKFDFFSGQVVARGRAVPVTRGEAAPATAIDGRFDLDLRIDGGALRPGGMAHLNLPFVERRTDGSVLEEEAAFDLTVEEHGGATLVRIDGSAPRIDLELAGLPPTKLVTGPARISVEAPATRLSALLDVERSLMNRAPEAAPVLADVDISAVRLTTPLGPAGIDLAANRLTGRVDLAGAAAQRLAVEGLRAEAVELAIDLPIAREAKEKGVRAAWSVDVRDARFDDIRGLDWLQTVRMRGQPKLTFDFAIAPDRSLDVRALEIRLPESGLVDEGGGLAGKIAIDLKLSPFKSAPGESPQVLAHANGSLVLDVKLASLEFLDRMFHKTAWFDVEGQGAVRADLRLDSGRILPGSSLDVPRADLRVRLRDDVASGSARASVRVEQGSKGPEERAEIVLSRFDLKSADGSGPAFARGTNLRIRAVGTHTRLDELAQDASVVATLERAEIPDLAAFRPYLPPSTGIDLAGGSGTVSLRIEADSGANTGRGTTTVRVPNAHVRLFDVGLRGALEFDGQYKSSDLADGAFALDGTRIALNDVQYEEGEDQRKTPWHGTVVLERARSSRSKPLAVRGRVRAEFADSGLLLSLYAAKKSFPAWISNLLNVQDVEAQGDFEVSAGGMVVDRLEIGGGHMHVRARLRKDQEHRAGDVYFKWGPFAAAAERDGLERKIHVKEPLRWFESRPPFLKPFGEANGASR